VVVTVAGLGWLLIVLLVLAVVRWALDRRRMAAWAAEWEKAERAWRRSAPLTGGRRPGYQGSTTRTGQEARCRAVEVVIDSRPRRPPGPMTSRSLRGQARTASCG
jgi:hypothetical protein